MTTTDSGCNGWSNYETWNVALWIGNTERLYKDATKFAQTSLHYGSMYKRFIEQCELKGLLWGKTGDGVSWTDENLDIAELDEYIKELGESDA